MLLLEDSWQSHRIHSALKGIPDDRDGLFDTIQRSKNHFQKRAYQCIKCLVSLFSSCPAAAHMLHSNGELKRKWTSAVEWLNDELERRPYGTNTQYGYNNWSPPAQSNESSNGYFLERSHSARVTLAKACELCPEEVHEQEEQYMSEEGDSPPPEEKTPPWQGTNQGVPQHPSPPPPAPAPAPEYYPATTDPSQVQQQQQQQQQPPAEDPPPPKQQFKTGSVVEIGDAPNVKGPASPAQVPQNFLPSFVIGSSHPTIVDYGNDYVYRPPESEGTGTDSKVLQ